MVTASQILLGIRKKYAKFPVLREVSVNDPWYYANYWRYQIDTYPWGASHAERAGVIPADEIDPNWSHLAPSYRRIDALILDTHRTAVEIKVTRSDFKADTEEKRAPWRHFTHKFVYAVPTGLVVPSEVPDYAGLWYFDESAYGEYPWQHGITIAKKAKRFDAYDLPPYLIQSLMGRLSRYEWDQERNR